MLDASNPNILSARSWLDDVTPGDVLLFAKPSLYGEEEQSPEPIAHLVFDVHAIADYVFIVLAEGRSVKSMSPDSCEIHVRSDAAMEAAGLTSPTCFPMQNRIILVDEHEGYCLQASGSAVIGRLANAERARLEAHRTSAKTHANRQSCQWAIEHLLPFYPWLPDARRKMIVPVPYSLQELAQPSGEI